MSNLYAVNFVFRECSINLGFVFKDLERAKALVDDVYDHILGIAKMYRVSDDFGSEGVIDVREIASVVINDISQDLEKNGEISLMRAKAEIKYTQAARSDPSFSILKPANNIISNQ